MWVPGTEPAPPLKQCSSSSQHVGPCLMFPVKQSTYVSVFSRVCTMCVPGACGSRKRKMGSDSLHVGTMDDCEPPRGCWELNSVPSKSNKCSLLTTDLLSPRLFHSNESKLMQTQPAGSCSIEQLLPGILEGIYQGHYFPCDYS